MEYFLTFYKDFSSKSQNTNNIFHANSSISTLNNLDPLDTNRFRCRIILKIFSRRSKKTWCSSPVGIEYFLGFDSIPPTVINYYYHLWECKYLQRCDHEEYWKFICFWTPPSISTINCRQFFLHIDHKLFLFTHHHSYLFANFLVLVASFWPHQK